MALTTLENVRAWLNVTSTADDALLTRMIEAASAFIETWLGRKILSANYVETRDGALGTRLITRNYPVTAVASVVSDGITIPLAASVSEHGYVFWPWGLALRGHGFTRGYGNVVISYTAGYASVPADIEQACCELVGLRYKERDRIGFVSKTLAGETVTFSTKDMSASIKTTLQGYKAVVPV
ncbi:MAG: head-tail connector protein [Burkholderiales bacterium]